MLPDRRRWGHQHAVADQSEACREIEAKAYRLLMMVGRVDSTRFGIGRLQVFPTSNFARTSWPASEVIYSALRATHKKMMIFAFENGGAIKINYLPRPCFPEEKQEFELTYTSINADFRRSFPERTGPAKRCCDEVQHGSVQGKPSHHESDLQQNYVCNLS
jgi:hypothetical protein